MSKKTIVVKLGTSVLTGGKTRLDRAHMIELVRQCQHLHQQGHRVVLVSSGAIAAGRELIKLGHSKLSISEKQMLAAVGQCRLIRVWDNLFALYELKVGQLLLTRADLEDRERYLNARDALQAVLEHGIVPIINENDAVATNEIKVGDNDNLSARVAMLADADHLLLLTDQRGLFTADPRKHPDAQLIKEVKIIDDTLRRLAGDSVSGLGTGGMYTKLQAADIARRAGINVTIAAGRAEAVIERVINGEEVGTRFPGLVNPLEHRKLWILAGPPAQGKITIDEGASRAILERGSSLLPKGIKDVSGDFHRGAVLNIYNPEQQLIARGLSRYKAEDLRVLQGHHSDQIESLLGYQYGDVAIHRDDLVVTQLANDGDIFK
ncbi:glutamate 5-kinase [Celerinatantimonas diazotrophica]|uniref:Glutamate 5-kinase n=1 Tax=Celerinatantimonas diazotrophica TaxID=412034 RepID=A0A4R1K3J5_9GAMM|nr:glutamate 5-kinase [Celerinatantimonas diazotrophica]TCK58655.1 glutamate 5-kinase [Celerinatantimonas diazotrophica]CAG9297284.1 Glutamate 5-kinase [Celerinatantimonas diazotrophica]